MRILGLSSFYHDSAAALITGGAVVAAAEEERFSRIKHDSAFPLQAAQFCLDHSGLTIADIDLITYYEKPLLKFERILDTFVKTYPFSLRPFLKTLPEWLTQKIKVEDHIRKKLGYKGKILFIPHHLSHAAAAFYPAPFREAAILTIDGVGEYQTTALWKGVGDKITPLGHLNFPHSLGLLYSTFTAFLGFRVNDDEYKVMGMGAYGRPMYIPEIKKLIAISSDGSFQLDLKYFSFREGFRMWSRDFERIFGAPRRPSDMILTKHYDLAASIQAVTEEIYFKILNHLHAETKLDSVCIGGGVALNALANGKIYQNTPFKKVYIFGPSGDSGAAVGSALIGQKLFEKSTTKISGDSLSLGSAYSNEQIKDALVKSKLPYQYIEKETDLISQTAYLLSQGRVVGWFQGRMELGPRALGNRSILAHPGLPHMKDQVNRVKFREQFRPFAASVLTKSVPDYFDVSAQEHPFPFMNFCFQVRPEKRAELSAVTHRDGTCRIQTVGTDSGRYFSLLQSFHRITGTPVMLNTSFNLKGEPIVESPTQAVKDFARSKMDALVIGDFLLTKKPLLTARR